MKQPTSRAMNLISKAIKALTVVLLFVLAVYVLLIILEGCITGGGIGKDLAINLASEFIAFTISLSIVNILTNYIARIKEKQRQLPLECILYARLFRILRDLIVNILPQEAYRENDSVYVSRYGDRVALGIDLKQESYSRLFSLAEEYVERKYADGEKFDAAPLDHVREQLRTVLDRSFYFLDPEFVSHMVRLETYLEWSVESLHGMKDEDWKEKLSRQKFAYSLSLVASAVVKVREWLDRMLKKHFEVMA